ncbi:YfhO family protein [Bizionia gelidisalsuginis]|uniref:YfhO family protein n=1 Tax=Bizionia gelidisalsuginis TaxID=291188 RepID=A0ABY3MC29_9FLAO|nr:YfhO family protein [Bizionia gelidisalsuginis]TYC14879.1 YfhO family protein [Bizionia gelidisalsuginis]
MHVSFKKILPHLLVFVGFIILSLAYFSPVLQGKQILQSDIVHYEGMAKQHKAFKAETGQETYWTNSGFAGMPTYQLGAKYPHNYIKQLDLALRFLPRPADYLFLYFIGFYILLLSLKVNYKLAALGALAFGFSTYLIIIIGVGHNSKAHAIAYFPLVLSGIILTFRRKYIVGFIITALALGLELVTNHYQMTYYLMLLVVVLGVAYLVDAYRKKVLPHYFKSVGILTVALVVAIGLNATGLLATQEYVKESTRGPSALTINADGSKKEAASSGLTTEYITEYSYGKLETFNLFIPRFMGGGMGEDIGKDSNLYDAYLGLGASPLQAKEAVKHAPMYWGDQPIVEAPAYVGAVIVFLFVFALFLVKGRLKWWLVGGTVLSLLLSYGKNFGVLTDLFIDYMPLYNKFRAVSSVQVILELCVPILGIFGLVKLFNAFNSDEEKLKALKYSVGITAGLAVVFLVFKSVFFDFIGLRDQMFRKNYGLDFASALVEDRKILFTNDTLRTLILVLLSAGTIFFFLKKKLNETKVIIVFAVLIVFDLVGVDRRYVNNDNFVSANKVEQPYQPNTSDLQILKDTSHYRVFDLASGGARASFFHNSLTGYHAAKLKRYNEVFDFYISQNNINVLNMLNAKYIIVPDEQQGTAVFTNEDANGNAWFVSQVKSVASPDEEILALNKLDNKAIAITTNEAIESAFTVDSLASITVLDYRPNYIKYDSKNLNEGFAVFSEMYYKEGWNAYVDGELKPIHKVNYTLRGLQTPKGRSVIEFKFEPQVVETGSSIALASSVLLAILILGGLFYEFKNRKKLSE